MGTFETYQLKSVPKLVPNLTHVYISDGSIQSEMTWRLACERSPSHATPAFQPGPHIPPTLVCQLRPSSPHAHLPRAQIESTAGGQLALKVHGVARVPQDDSVNGNVVQIMTTAGTITLDDVLVSFTGEAAPVFVRAGFPVSTNRRSLLGGVSSKGFFNSAPADDGASTAADDVPAPAAGPDQTWWDLPGGLASKAEVVDHPRTRKLRSVRDKVRLRAGSRGEGGAVATWQPR
jgi:hypothetical protein